MPQLLLFYGVTTAITVFAWWRIFGRLGWPPYYSLVAAVPFAGIAVLIFVAITRWPIEERLTTLQRAIEERHGER